MKAENIFRKLIHDDGKKQTRTHLT